MDRRHLKGRRVGITHQILDDLHVSSFPVPIENSLLRHDAAIHGSVLALPRTATKLQRRNARGMLVACFTVMTSKAS